MTKYFDKHGKLIPHSGVWCYECRKTILFANVDNHQHYLGPKYPINKKEETTVTMQEPNANQETKIIDSTAVEVVAPVAAVPPSPPKVRDELHVNIIIKGNKILLGVKADDCDPKMTTLTGTLQNALERVPTYVAECNAQWDLAAHNPKAPEPPKPPPAPPRPVTTSSSKPAAPAPVKAQPNFF